ncbi:hypothetical protein [Streptomyces sp. NPDC059411]|uniref:hypothetical protein n=1 Tax=Streptomyces sp. NPDC059411 TaxID=3346825 RepID=UPI00368C931E
MSPLSLQSRSHGSSTASTRTRSPRGSARTARPGSAAAPPAGAGPPPVPEAAVGTAAGAGGGRRGSERERMADSRA